MVSVNQLSSYGAVADTCEELASSNSGNPVSAGRPVAVEKPESMYSPTELFKVS